MLQRYSPGGGTCNELRFSYHGCRGAVVVIFMLDWVAVHCCVTLMNINEPLSRGQVVERIRAVHGQTKLLVIAAEADAFFRKHHLPVSSRLPLVTVCPSAPPGDYNQHQRRQHGM